MQTASPFNGFIVIVIVKLKQKKKIKKAGNRDLRNLGRIARNPVENSSYLVNVFLHSLICFQYLLFGADLSNNLSSI